MSKQLFGTDGIRGKAGEYPLDPSTVSHLGSALSRYLIDGGGTGRILIGYDTRESSVPLCGQMMAGVRAGGGAAAVAGVIPTPGVAYLTRTGEFDAGVVISASHNAYQDNGIKVFQADGTKLPDADEARLEAMVLKQGAPALGTGQLHREVPVNDDLPREYIGHLLHAVRGRVDLSGTRLVVDCANGASAAIAAPLFHGLGVETVFLADRPDGRNINQDCGSMHPAHLSAAVRKHQAHMGLALDGDADRCLAVDDLGHVLDGDYILYLTALYLKLKNRLRHDVVVATVMSNLWLEQALEREGIALTRTPVGDKYVLEEMIRGDHVLGGEQSGHVIFRDHSTTGDGLLTGLTLLKVWKHAGRPLSEMVAGITPCPQVLFNVAVRSKPDLDTHPHLGPVLARARQALVGRGRLLVRYSGTETLARVMTEGNDSDEIRRIAEEVAAALAQHLA